MTKEISFDFSTYVEKNATNLDRRLKEEQPKAHRTRRRKIMRVVSKVATVAREVLDIYSAVKRKDPISVALGVLSTYGCVSELFEGEVPQAQAHLKEMGAVKAFPMMCAFIFHTLQQMDIPSRRIWNSGENKDEGENTQEGIEEFDLGNNTKVWFIDDAGNSMDGPEHGPYVMDAQKFVGRFSEVVEEKLGKILTINTILKGWEEFYYLALCGFLRLSMSVTSTRTRLWREFLIYRSSASTVLCCSLVLLALVKRLWLPGLPRGLGADFLWLRVVRLRTRAGDP